uniref:PiggyBac transposable element-derived protein domain-containing protein n=1 Tax=Magallana gigas TaxID=29159 RepID=A0A8W8P1P5_MAGGI
MESSDDSSTEFEGFGPEVVEAAREDLLEVVEVNQEAISDIDISDISDTESESENDDNPLEENENGDRRTWREMLRNVDLEDFTGTPGPTKELNATAEEIDFFHLMFPDDLYELIATETNRYAEQKQEKNGVDGRWKGTSKEEIRAYIAIQIVMGIVVAPNQGMYFTKDDLFRSTGINGGMTRDRLDKLNQTLAMLLPMFVLCNYWYIPEEILVVVKWSVTLITLVSKEI